MIKDYLNSFWEKEKEKNILNYLDLFKFERIYLNLNKYENKSSNK